VKIKLFTEGVSEWREMLEEVIKENTGAIDIDWRISTDYHPPEGYTWAYIDHQSAACEGSNTEMFNSRDDLKNFLFCPDSLIQTGNDNE
jgi:hypothetical protein